MTNKNIGLKSRDKTNNNKKLAYIIGQFPAISDNGTISMKVYKNVEASRLFVCNWIVTANLCDE
jgi:hypothetical protein